MASSPLIQHSSASGLELIRDGRNVYDLLTLKGCVNTKSPLRETLVIGFWLYRKSSGVRRCAIRAKTFLLTLRPCRREPTEPFENQTRLLTLGLR